MTGGSFFQVDVRCPYYRSDNGRSRILCEGIVPGSKLISNYEQFCDFETQMRHYCMDGYWRCEICSALDEKYEE